MCPLSAERPVDCWFWFPSDLENATQHFKAIVFKALKLKGNAKVFPQAHRLFSSELRFYYLSDKISAYVIG